MTFASLLGQSLQPFIFNGLRDFYSGDSGVMVEILVVELGGVKRLVLVGWWCEWESSQPTQNKFSELSENSENYPHYV